MEEKSGENKSDYDFSFVEIEKLSNEKIAHLIDMYKVMRGNKRLTEKAINKTKALIIYLESHLKSRLVDEVIQ